MLKVNTISFSYNKAVVLSAISFSLEKGKHLSIMGESGSGKSTLLKAIYGELHLNKGSISWNDKPLLGPNFNLIPGESFIKYVSQDFDLMPFTTVAENIGEHLSVFEKDAHQERITELLKLIGLEAFAHEKVKNLSGGQKQRVALARAIAQEPELILFDEPFSHIDQFKKNELRHRLFPYLREKGISVITATHDQNDVLSFADDILVLKDGEIEDYRPTKQLFKNPKNHLVASLFGMVNEIPLNALKEYGASEMMILVYPHEFEISSTSGMEVYVVNNYFKGNHHLVEGVTKGGQTVFFNHLEPIRPNSKVYLNVSLDLVNARIKVNKGHES